MGATKTGRFSCSQPNLQQVPTRKFPELRKCFVARDDHVFVAGDWKQMELRVAGWISQDPVFNASYATGADIHSTTAIALAGTALPPDGKPTAEQRGKAKAANFLCLYHGGAKKMAENATADYGIVITEAEARGIILKFRATYRVYDQWCERERTRCNTQRFVSIGAGAGCRGRVGTTLLQDQRQRSL